MKLSRLIIYSSARGGRVTVKLLWRDDRDKQATLKVADANHDAARVGIAGLQFQHRYDICYSMCYLVSMLYK